MKQLLDPKKISRSIYEAIYLTRDCEKSIARIKKIIASLPPGSVHIVCSENRVKFYEYLDGRAVHLSKHSNKIYPLCRKRYLMLLLKILELVNCLYETDTSSQNSDADPGVSRTKANMRVSDIHCKIKDLTSNLMKLLDSFSKGNLDVARIVLTTSQYRWYTRKYAKKKFVPKTAHKTGCGIEVRSKSERDAGNCYENFAVPYHYEELIVIDATKIIKKLHQDYAHSVNVTRSLCFMKNGGCFWDVPSELQWMNAPGSIWRAYDPVTGKIRIFSDFQVMLADSELMVHEHEGMLDDFIYRCNANERTSVMILSGAVKRENLITTSEYDIDNIEYMENIIRECILPRLWF